MDHTTVQSFGGTPKSGFRPTSWVANSLMPESLDFNFDNVERRPLHEFSKPGWNEMESGMFRRTEFPVFRYATYGNTR